MFALMYPQITGSRAGYVERILAANVPTRRSERGEVLWEHRTASIT